MKPTTEDIAVCMTKLCESFNNELFSKNQEELESYFHFRWGDSLTAEQNMYKFYDMLKLYESVCRRWEEHHNGSCCIVERVRDKYLMPKINNFLSCIFGGVQ